MTRLKTSLVLQRCMFVVVVLLLPLAMLFGQQDRIVGRIGGRGRVTLSGNVHPKAQQQYDQGAVEPSLKLSYITLALKKSAAQQTALDELLRQQQDPSSPVFHRWLTPEEYADRFGLSQNDIDKIVDWLQSRGLKVEHLARSRNWIDFTGTAEQIQAAFRTEIHRYRVDGELHFANSTAPSIAAELESVVLGLYGLDDFHPKPPTRRGIDTNGTAPGSALPRFTSTDGTPSLAPDDLAMIYDITPLYNNGFDGSGQRLVVVGQTDIDLADIRAFRNTFSLPANDPQLVLYGPDPGTKTKDLGEADLDLEWSGAIARNATVIYVYSKNVFGSAQYAIDQNLAPVISMSYGACELGVSLADAVIFQAWAQQANAQGITLLASSGDSGAGDCDRQEANLTAKQGRAVDFPASIPEVTAVGGTAFSDSSGNYWSNTNGGDYSSVISYIPEIAWNETGSNGLAASGGGFSMFFAKPAWQVGLGVPSDSARDVPDVSLSAATHDGYIIVSSGKFIFSIGGTSASTPVFAGIVTILNQSQFASSGQSQPGLGNINPNLYALAQNVPNVFHDITSGNNIVPCQQGSPDCSSGSFGYTAGPGYDQVTGLGSVDAYNLVTNWSALNPPKLPALAVTWLTSDIRVVLGGKINIGATVVNQGQADAGPFRFGQYLATSPTLQSGQTPFAYCDFTSLAAGATTTCTRQVNLPTGIQPGTYYLIAVADILNQVVQSDQSQNVRFSDSGPVTVVPPACTYSLSSMGVQGPASSGNGSFTVNTQGGCSWNASSNINWITITSGSRGTGSGTVVFNVGANSGAARTGTISVANQQFTISQSAYANVTLQFSNSLIYPVNISANGTLIGSVNGSSTASLTVPALQSLQVSFELVRPIVGGVPIGDPMIGYYNTINNPAGMYTFNVNNQIGTQFYFAPLITNTSAAPLLMDVNGGLQAENRCNCVVPAGGTNIALGYYQLFSSSNVEAFRNGSGYGGHYYFFDNFMSFVGSQTGILRLTFNQSP